MKNKPKVAVIGLKGLPAFGGAAFVGENIIEKLKNEYSFTVYSTSSHTSLKSGLYRGYCQIVFHSLPFKRLNSLYYYIISAFHACLFGNYDVIHIHHSDAAFIIPILKLRFPIIITTHGAFNLTSKWLKYDLYFKIQIKAFVPLADVLTCVSKKELRIFSEKRNVRPIFIPNGIPEIQINNSKTEDYILFAAGRLIESKGCHFLLQALKKTNFKGKVMIAGDFNQSQAYFENLKSLSNGLDCSFLGLIIEKSQLYSLISQAKLFVYPSMLEAMSIMLFETASIGTPIICSDIEGNTDVFARNEVLFFKNMDIDDLSEKICYALSNYFEMQSRAVNARQRLFKEYSWQNIAIQYSELYKSLLR